jgi:undecaprenyl phosphate-alpha-L-ara4N flippase subunit ArnE
MNPAQTLTAWTVGLILFCVLAEVGTQLNFKAAADSARPERPVASLLSQPLLWIGILLWAIEAVAWLLVLEHARLAVAFPIMTLTYAATPLAAGLVLNEQLTRGQKLGAALIAVGAMVVALSDLRGAA